MPTAVLLALALAALPGPAPACPGPPELKVPDLDFDPARPEPIVGWWSNGRELLHLAPNGAYRMWPTLDRFRPPAEFGAWRRENYVFFDLEPYRAKPGTRIRVNMQKDAGVTELVRDGLADFRWSAAPPRTLADDMLGTWIGATERLVVLDSGRYEWNRTAEASGITGHAGAWTTEHDILVLDPDSPAIEPVRMRLVRPVDGPLALESADGRLMHPPEPPTPAPSPGPGLLAPGSGNPAPSSPARPGNPNPPHAPAAPAPPASGAAGGTKPTSDA